MGKGNKGTYKEIIKKRAEGAKGAKGDSESEGGTPAAPTKGCHITESYHIICRKPKVPAPALGADDGVKMLCTSKKCPFAESQYVHRECFEYATGKIIDALRTTTSRWANEHYTYNAWNQRGYDQLGRFECPCGKGSQTLDDSKFVYRKDGTCITMEQHRAEMVENAMKAVKPEKAKNAPGYKRAPAVSQWELEKKLDREFATEKKRGLLSHSYEERSSTSHLEPVFERTPIPEEEAPPKDPTLEPGYMDGDGFVTVG